MELLECPYDVEVFQSASSICYPMFGLPNVIYLDNPFLTLLLFKCISVSLYLEFVSHVTISDFPQTVTFCWPMPKSNMATLLFTAQTASVISQVLAAPRSCRRIASAVFCMGWRPVIPSCKALRELWRRSRNTRLRCASTRKMVSPYT